MGTVLRASLLLLLSLPLWTAAAPPRLLSAAPAALNFGSWPLGQSSDSLSVQLSNTGSAPVNLSKITISGDFSHSHNCASRLAVGAGCSIAVRFMPSVAGARSGTLSISSNASNSPATVSLSGSGEAAPDPDPGGGSGGSGAALTLVSRGLHVEASSASYPAANAVDADYNSEWRSAGVPATLAFDLSGLSASSRQHLLLAWYNDASYGYDHALVGQVGYNNPGSYTLEGNTAAGGGAPPSSGWVVLGQVSRNTRHSLQHVLDLGSHPWLRMNFSASDGSPGNADIAINVDLYEAPSGVGDGWLFAGDSITANCMGHRDLGSVRAAAFGSLISASNPPPQENAGMPGWTSAELLVHLGGWLASFPGRYVTLNLGTNDAVALTPDQFRSNMAQLVQMVLNAGKTPLLPTIPYSTEPTHKANIPALNTRIRELYAAYPALIPGPDLYAYFQANPALLAADGVHLSNQGCAAYRQLWANTALASVY